MLNDFQGLDEGYFVQLRREQGRQEGYQEGLAEGRAKGREQGLVEGRQEALLTVIELYFPTLVEWAQQRVRQAKNAEYLRLAIKGVVMARSEEPVRLLLELIAT